MHDFFFFLVYNKTDVTPGSKHSNGDSLDSRYTADPNQRGGVQTRADIIRPRHQTPCKPPIPHQPRKTNSPVFLAACVYFILFY